MSFIQFLSNSIEYLETNFITRNNILRTTYGFRYKKIINYVVISTKHKKMAKNKQSIIIKDIINRRSIEALVNSSSKTYIRIGLHVLGQYDNLGLWGTRNYCSIEIDSRNPHKIHLCVWLTVPKAKVLNSSKLKPHDWNLNMVQPSVDIGESIWARLAQSRVGYYFLLEYPG